MKKYIWLCCIILFVAVCSSRMPGYQGRTIHDEFDGYTKNTLQVNELSGADSKGHNLPEPSAEKVQRLIAGLGAIEVKLKSNLRRLEIMKSV